MTRSQLPGLERDQLALVTQWFPGAALVQDLSWGQVDTVVLRLRPSHGEDVVVKAGQTTNTHILREITAHESGALAPLVGRGPVLLHADRGCFVLATRYLPGRLVDAVPDLRDDPEVHRQAAELLRLLHDQPSVVEDGYGHRMDAKALAWLDQPHHISPAVERRLRELLSRSESEPATSVPTHGDWQPRNWLWHDGRVYVIDLGRFDRRPAETDLTRLAHQHWREHPDLERAFVDGYGGDPRGSRTWPRERLREAIGTACYAVAVGDEAFEAQGHRMITAALAEL